MLSAKQHFLLANYVRQNQQAQRSAGRTLADPAWQMKRAQSFLSLARMTAKRIHAQHAPKHPRSPGSSSHGSHGSTKIFLQPQLGPSTLHPNGTQALRVKPNAAPPAITGTPALLGAGLLQLQGAIPGARLPGAAGAARPNMGASRPIVPHMRRLPRIG
jgi:hypothetical protein